MECFPKPNSLIRVNKGDMQMRINLLCASILVIISMGLVECTPNITSSSLTTSTTQRTSTITPNLSPTISLTPTLSFTPTTFSTLPPDQQEKNIKALLGTNQCDLPCWWGITPGVTSRVDAEQIYRNLIGANLEEVISPKLNGFILYDGMLNSQLPNEDINFEFEFFTLDNVIQYIQINSNGTKSTPPFKTIWGNLAPERVVSALGVPSRIKLRISYNPGEGQITSAILLIYLFYDKQGILLEYAVVDTFTKPVYSICPTFGDSGNTANYLQIILKSPTDGKTIESYDGAYNPNLNVDLKDATGITPEDFYNLFIQSGKPICINTLPGVFKRP